MDKKDRINAVRRALPGALERAAARGIPRYKAAIDMKVGARTLARFLDGDTGNPGETILEAFESFVKAN